MRMKIIADACAVSIVAAKLLLGLAAGQERSSPVLIRGGTFMMGTPANAISELKARYSADFPEAFENELPAHRVSLSDFRLDRHEVTKAQFAAFIAARPEWHRQNLSAALHNGHYLEDWVSGRYPKGQDAYPVVFVTWHAAQSYCRWMGGRLPTESEWEYAARGGGNVEFPWGDELPTPKMTNYSGSGFARAVPVAQYPPNAFGLFDMAGNVWELLLDEWKERYPPGSQVDPIAGGAVPDDRLLAVRGRRVLRGGSFGAATINLRTRWRDSHIVTNAVDFVGFRCAYPSTK
jgi:formylglycine-generating enzyme required for sulfatase activity